MIGKGSINSWFGQMTNMLIQENAIHSYFRHDDKYEKRFYCVKTVRYELLTKLSFFFTSTENELLQAIWKNWEPTDNTCQAEKWSVNDQSMKNIKPV